MPLPALVALATASHEPVTAKDRSMTVLLVMFRAPSDPLAPGTTMAAAALQRAATARMERMGCWINFIGFGDSTQRRGWRRGKSFDAPLAPAEGALRAANGWT